jgi:hypothetical protein
MKMTQMIELVMDILAFIIGTSRILLGISPIPMGSIPPVARQTHFQLAAQYTWGALSGKLEAYQLNNCLKCTVTLVSGLSLTSIAYSVQNVNM